jgi:hypothetical protein
MLLSAPKLKFVSTLLLARGCQCSYMKHSISNSMDGGFMSIVPQTSRQTLTLQRLLRSTASTNSASLANIIHTNNVFHDTRSEHGQTIQGKHSIVCGNNSLEAASRLIRARTHGTNNQRQKNTNTALHIAKRLVIGARAFSAISSPNGFADIVSSSFAGTIS